MPIICSNVKWGFRIKVFGILLGILANIFDKVLKVKESIDFATVLL